MRRDWSALVAALVLGCGGKGGPPPDECEVDADCAADEACRVHFTDPARVESWKDCVPASCRADADCDGGACRDAEYWTGCEIELVVSCTSPEDSCATDGDCAGLFTADTGGTTRCLPWTDDGGLSLSTAAPRVCVSALAPCAIGRPLTVDGRGRTAPVIPRSDWSDGLASVAAPPPVAAALADRWEAIARLEHASVASFARFTLELLALGAPPDLVGDAQRAALDEVEHARLAFALAGHFAGRPTGPGPLSVDGAAPRTNPAEVLSSLLVEGCVGETVGAALAAAQAAAATDPGLAGVLRRIAEDEARHAALAWRTAEWLVGGWPELKAGLDERVARAVGEVRADLLEGPAGVPGWGAPAPEEAARLASEVGAVVRGWARHLAAAA